MNNNYYGQMKKSDLKESETLNIQDSYDYNQSFTNESIFGII